MLPPSPTLAHSESSSPQPLIPSLRLGARGLASLTFGGWAGADRSMTFLSSGSGGSFWQRVSIMGSGEWALAFGAAGESGQGVVKAQGSRVSQAAKGRCAGASQPETLSSNTPTFSTGSHMDSHVGESSQYRGSSGPVLTHL